MKKYILTFIICALTLTGCTEEAVISGGAGADAQQNEQQIPYSTDTALISLPPETAAVTTSATAADTTETDPEAPQSVEEWEEWECIAERPDECNDNVTVTDVSSPKVISDPVPADTTSEDSVNTTPATFNDPLPTMTLTEYTDGTAQFAIQNDTSCEWGYGLEPFFHKFNEDEGAWFDVKPITDISYIEIYCILQPGGSSTYTMPIEQYYGALTDGKYRAGLLMRNHETEMAELITCEFSVIDGETAVAAEIICCY